MYDGFYLHSWWKEIRDRNLLLYTTNSNRFLFTELNALYRFTKQAQLSFPISFLLSAMLYIVNVVWARSGMSNINPFCTSKSVAFPSITSQLADHLELMQYTVYCTPQTNPSVGHFYCFVLLWGLDASLPSRAYFQVSGPVPFVRQYIVQYGNQEQCNYPMLFFPTALFWGPSSEMLRLLSSTVVQLFCIRIR